MMDASVAFALMPHASALLMEDLKRLCEVTLVSACDEANAAATSAEIQTLRTEVAELRRDLARHREAAEV